MNRLTKDLHTPHDDTTYSDIVKNAIDRENIVLTKLKHYEDIEEELGIDLVVLIKAMKNGFYDWTGRDHDFQTIWFGKRPQIETTLEYFFDLSEYGRIWALTKEELENDQ